MIPYSGFNRNLFSNANSFSKGTTNECHFRGPFLKKILIMSPSLTDAIKKKYTLSFKPSDCYLFNNIYTWAQTHTCIHDCIKYPEEVNGRSSFTATCTTCLYMTSREKCDQPQAFHSQHPSSNSLCCQLLILHRSECEKSLNGRE